MTLSDLQPAEDGHLLAIGEGAAALETLTELDPLFRELATAHDEWEAWLRATSEERAEGLVSRAYKDDSMRHFYRRTAVEAKLLAYARAYVAAAEVEQ